LRRLILNEVGPGAAGLYAQPEPFELAIPNEQVVSLIIQTYEWVEKFTRQVQAEQSTKMHVDPCKIRAVCSSVVPLQPMHGFGAATGKIDRLSQVKGVPDKKALAALKEAKRKLDELYRGVSLSRNCDHHAGCFIDFWTGR
jgi:hypothetical protein